VHAVLVLLPMALTSFSASAAGLPARVAEEEGTIQFPED
jgi:hypothetical protein